MDSVPLPVLLFGITFVVEALSWIGNDALVSIFYTPVRLLSSSPTAKQQRALKAQVLSLSAKLKATSAQDEFSKWAKLRRKVDKSVAELEALKAGESGSRAAFAAWFKRIVWVATTILPFVISSWHRRSAVFYLPVGWFGPATWWMSLPSAPAGGIACGLWTMACKRTLSVLRDIVIDFAPGKVVAPKVEVPVSEKPAAKDEL